MQQIRQTNSASCEGACVAPWNVSIMLRVWASRRSYKGADFDLSLQHLTEETNSYSTSVDGVADFSSRKAALALISTASKRPYQGSDIYDFGFDFEFLVMAVIVRIV